MKKYVLSAVVLGLMAAPSAYAMDGGAAPAVEVDVPAVEIDSGLVAVDPLEEIDTGVVLETPVEFDHGDIVLGLPVDEDASGIDVRVECFDLTTDGSGQVDENGNPLVYYCMGGIAVDGEEVPVEGGDIGEIKNDVDQSDFDLASQSGVGVTNLDGDTEVPLRSLENIQPNFRGGITDRGAEALAASAGGDDTPNPQLLNDEQRGAVRGLRSDEERAKPRAGFSKLFSKFSKPKSEVTLVSATTAGKSLSSKLADVDRMRDTALRTGDQKMLAKADKLEKRLRSEASKVSKVSTRTR